MAHPFWKLAECTYDSKQITLYDPAITFLGIYGEMKIYVPTNTYLQTFIIS